MKLGLKRILVLGDIHFPHPDDEAVACALGIARTWRPHEVWQLGDLCDGGQFSTHPRKSRLERRAVAWPAELNLAGAFWDEVHEVAPGARCHWLLGNHEARAERELLDTPWGEGLYNLVSPQRVVGASRKWLEVHEYGEAFDAWPMVAGGLYATHAVDHGRHATASHLQTCAPWSVIHGDTHRPVQVFRTVPGLMRTQQAISPGCLCDLQPAWLRGRPSGWAHGVALITVAEGQRWNASLVSIERGGRAILPWGEEVRA